MVNRFGEACSPSARPFAHSDSLFPWLLKTSAEMADGRLDASCVNRMDYLRSGPWEQIMIIASDPAGLTTLSTCPLTLHVSGHMPQSKQGAPLAPGKNLERLGGEGAARRGCPGAGESTSALCPRVTESPQGLGTRPYTGSPLAGHVVKRNASQCKVAWS